MEVVLYELDAQLEADIRARVEGEVKRAVQVPEKLAREAAIEQLKAEVVAAYEQQEADEETIKQVKEILHKLVKEEVRRLITEEKCVQTDEK